LLIREAAIVAGTLIKGIDSTTSTKSIRCRYVVVHPDIILSIRLRLVSHWLVEVVSILVELSTPLSLTE
jgi:hypothetical protein